MLHASCMEQYCRRLFLAWLTHWVLQSSKGKPQIPRLGVQILGLSGRSKGFPVDLGTNTRDNWTVVETFMPLCFCDS